MLSQEGNKRLLAAVRKDDSMERRSMHCLFATYWYKFLEDVTTHLTPVEKHDCEVRIVERFENLYEGEGAPGAMLTVLMRQEAVNLIGYKPPITELPDDDDDILNQIARLLDGPSNEEPPGHLSGDEL